LPDNKCKKCDYGNIVDISRNPLQPTTASLKIGLPAQALNKVNNALSNLNKIGISGSINFLEVTGTITSRKCCEKSIGEGTKEQGSVSADFGGFSAQAKIWPPGPIPPAVKVSASTFGVTFIIAGQLVGGWFADLSANVNGVIGYKKDTCSLNDADRAGCYFAELNTTITPGSSISIAGTGSVTVDCAVCNSATGAIIIKGGGAVAWPMNVSQVQYNSASCSSGLVGGIFEVGPINAKISAQVDASLKTTSGNSYQYSTVVNVVDCSIDSNLVVTCQ
jgi:hypothetical protein